MNNTVKPIKNESGRITDFEVVREETSLNGLYVGNKIKEIKYEVLRK